MEKQNVPVDTGDPLVDLPIGIREFSDQLGCEKYSVIRQEMDKIILYLHRSDYCESWQDAIHNLFISLFHLENMEKTLYSSDLSEELLHQTKIIAKLQAFKMAILHTIHEIEIESTEGN